jgi:hypothetical protein
MLLFNRCDIAEASVLGQILAKNALEYKEPFPECLLYVGESTVTIKGNGSGGRNMELALAAGIEIVGHRQHVFFGIAQLSILLRILTFTKSCRNIMEALFLLIVIAIKISHHQDNSISTIF